LGQPKCGKCGWFGHVSNDCRRNLKRKRDDDGGGPKQKKAKQEQVNQVAESGSEKGSTEMTFAANEADNFCITYNAQNGQNNDSMILYDWLADSATTSHVVNSRDAFTTYVLLNKPYTELATPKLVLKEEGLSGLRP